MGLKRALTIIIIGLILISISYVVKTENDSILGNWKSIESDDSSEIHTELFIDDETINVFSEEVNEIIFSNYYRIAEGKLFVLEENKKDTIFSFEFIVSGNSLKISGGKMSSEYTKILQGKTMEDYINDNITKADYIKEFNKRKLIGVEE
ncbi:hypothetical protein [Ulvibacterium marinum]|uniref:DUF5640 domain-containing protein n=1 Tax=Ulvibacterium marinum TaxID=2419782 RepID=A0A3B0BSN7_9FLAO|nr:hypothetical protein [Ulvibacterium marinum]RKN75912.1 hypothetical protein D7Z94_24940 [Ulvibacterium marinum]